MESFTDTALLAQIMDDDHDAFDILFDRYWKKRYQTAFARLDDDPIAQDVVQEIFIKIWQRRKSLNYLT